MCRLLDLDSTSFQRRAAGGNYYKYKNKIGWNYFEYRIIVSEDTLKLNKVAYIHFKRSYFDEELRGGYIDSVKEYKKTYLFW